MKIINPFFYILLVTLFFLPTYPSQELTASTVRDYPLILQMETASPQWEEYGIDANNIQLINKEKAIYQLMTIDKTQQTDLLNQLQDYQAIKHVLIDDVVQIDNRMIQATELEVLQNQYQRFIQLDEAKTVEDGSNAVTIAVLDTGIDQHLQQMNPRILSGFDVVTSSYRLSDMNGHGTMIASLIAHSTNTDGYQTLTNHINILPIRIAENDGFIYKSNILKGLQYAIDQQVNVINMSYSGTSYNPLEDELLKEAHQAGITLVAASGNEGIEPIGYPAKYQTTIAVGAHDVPSAFSIEHLINNNIPLARSYFSNYGNQLSVTAPGTNIPGYVSSDQLALATGTSFAAPFVSSLAALLESKDSTLTPLEIERMIQEGATYYQNRWTQELGYGATNFYQTLTISRPDLASDLANTTTAALKAHRTMEDNFQLPDDQDWMRLSLTQNMENFEIEFQGTADFTEPRLAIYNSTMTLLHDGLTPGVHTLDLAQGEYFVKISERFGRWTDETYRLTFPFQLYQDVLPASAHYDGINYLTQRDILNGYQTDDDLALFKVNDSIKRGQVAAIFQRLLQLSIPSDKETIISQYSDVSNANYYADAIAANFQANIMTGTKQSATSWLFNSGPMTREQMASVLVRALQLDEAVSNKSVPIELANVSLTHQTNVQILADLGLTNQLDDFRPKEFVSRGQFSTFLYRSLQLAN